MKARHFQALALARGVLSRELRRKGPVRWESQRGLTTSETCRVRYDSQYSRHSAMVGLTLDVSTAPYPTVTGAVHAPGAPRPLSDGQRSPNARMHANADPRRTLSFTIASQTIARSPDGSEISSAAKGATGSGRRLRQTVPRKHHRHEQLQSLQQHTSSFEKEERTRACGRWWRRNPRCALSRGEVPPRVCRECQ